MKTYERKCELNPDESKECSCLVMKEQGLVCDVYDEPIIELEKCPLTEMSE